MWIHGGTNAEHPLTQLCLKYGIAMIKHGVRDWDTIRAFDLSGKIHSNKDFESVEKVLKV